MKYMFLLLFFVFGTAQAADLAVYELAIKDHVFIPASVEIPANTRVKLLVKNQDATPEEFESIEFNREKIVPGNSEISIYVGPLDAGEYKFYGEFNQATAQGKLIVK